MTSNWNDETIDKSKPPEAQGSLNFDEVWPVHPTARWPEGLSLRREDLYGDRVELEAPSP